MHDVYVKLNTGAVTTIIRDQQLKRWWVAEVTGVHKTTLRRWLNGKIERVRDDHADRLAAVLTVEKARIVESRPRPRFAAPT